MKKISATLIALFVFSFTSSVSASAYPQWWDKQCLHDCFSTGHDCNFCSYQCEAREYPATPYVGNLPCPLETTGGRLY
jgi:hypothetical protein